MDNRNPKSEDNFKDRLIKFISRMLALVGFLLVTWPREKEADDTVSNQTEESEEVNPIEENIKSIEEESGYYDWAISEPDGYIGDHAYVDLKLPSGLKWATCNLSASEAEESGDYFQWAQTVAQQANSETDNLTYDKDYQWMRVNGYLSNSGNLNIAYDATSHNWGSSWRMPTLADFEELFRHTSSKWVSCNGQKGRMLKSKKNGKCIFMPAQGNMFENELYSYGKHGYYWTSTIDPSNSSLSYYFYFTSSGRDIFNITRNYGFAIRAVAD